MPASTTVPLYRTPKLVIGVDGDSQSQLGNTYTRAGRMWPCVLETMLRDLGMDAGVYDPAATSGDTTTQMLTRLHQLFRLTRSLDLAVLYIGVNDPGASISSATTQANIQAAVKAVKFGAAGALGGDGRRIGPVSVANVAALPAAGRPGDRYVVLSDTDTTGGQDADPTLLAAGAVVPTITGSVTADANGQKQSVWECTNARAGAAGSRRVAVTATTPTHCKRVVVVSTNYLNWTTGGDTPATPFASYAAVRVAQQAAVTAENVLVGGVASVVYADLYAWQRNLIVNGKVPNFSADTSIVPTTAYDATLDWHYTQNNQHHNPFGNRNVAQCTAATIAAVAQWVTDLKALAPLS